MRAVADWQLFVLRMVSTILGIDSNSGYTGRSGCREEFTVSCGLCELQKTPISIRPSSRAFHPVHGLTLEVAARCRRPIEVMLGRMRGKESGRKIRSGGNVVEKTED